MRFKCIILFCAVGFVLTAQRIQVVAQYELPLKNQKEGFYPVLNAEGDLLLYSTGGYKGLYLFNLRTGEERSISTVQNAGYSPIFSNDSRRVFFRNTTFDQGKRYDALMSYELKSRKETQMIAPQRNLRTATNYDNGTVVKAGGKLYKATFGRSKALVPAYVSSEDLKIFVYNNGKRSEIAPIAGENINYIWVSLSPDNTKILFTAVGKGTYICNLAGKVLAEIGYLNAPVWFGNDFVVGMCDKDNGEYVTSSEIVVVSADGKYRQSVSDAKHIAMYPAASRKANRIVYNTVNGKLIVSEISIQ